MTIGRRVAVKDRRAMLSGMTPVLEDGDYVFCTTPDPDTAGQGRPEALGWFVEDEGVTLILPLATAEKMGFDVGLTMVRIVLQVFSALDGVGLTAAVSSALADAGIPCNMVAGYHHDHVFVPSAMARRAIDVLQNVQNSSGGSGG